MNRVFPDANVIAGVLVLVVGFGLHWVGQRVFRQGRVGLKSDLHLTQTDPLEKER